MKHTKQKSIPRKNAVIKKPAFLRGISYFLIKMERIGISRFLHDYEVVDASLLFSLVVVQK